MFSLEITITTWLKDSHGLYDYDALEDAYKRETLYVKNNCKILRDLEKN